jgi:hypothetical protein
VIQVKQFPVVVTMDAHGGSLHAEVESHSKDVAAVIGDGVMVSAIACFTYHAAYIKTVSSLDELSQVIQILPGLLSKHHMSHLLEDIQALPEISPGLDVISFFSGNFAQKDESLTYAMLVTVKSSITRASLQVLQLGCNSVRQIPSRQSGSGLALKPSCHPAGDRGGYIPILNAEPVVIAKLELGQSHPPERKCDPPVILISARKISRFFKRLIGSPRFPSSLSAIQADL